ncbi:MAG TPA: tryptophan--tRNA ligase [Gemmataceae bacterium]|nr:tryptophan--tRNA ligase [Gemmataceae bacterium]
MASERRKRILSGVQPSGKLHIGNYFGAIKQHIALQDEGECFYFIADYHALTTLGEAVRADVEQAKEAKRKPRSAADILRENVRDVAIDYLALGLDPKKATFYRQSDVPEVAELAWILSTVTGMGLLERAHSYKDKLAKGITPSVGLFTYPILMAADILIVRSHMVPVGQDQVQHLEMTRDIAGYFNQTFGVDLFPLPAERLDVAAKVPGTDGQKMSKSYGNTIDIFAEGKALKKSVMGIVTDSTPPEAPKDPETRTPYQLYRLFATPDEAKSLADHYRAGGMGDGEAKQMLLTKIDTYFGPFRERRKKLAADPGYVEDVLRDGAKRARAEAVKTMELVREATGFPKRPA